MVDKASLRFCEKSGGGTIRWVTVDSRIVGPRPRSALRGLRRSIIYARSFSATSPDTTRFHAFRTRS